MAPYPRPRVTARRAGLQVQGSAQAHILEPLPSRANHLPPPVSKQARNHALLDSPRDGVYFAILR